MGKVDGAMGAVTFDPVVCELLFAEAGVVVWVIVGLFGSASGA